MAEMDQLRRALVNAHNAGDTEAARTIANEIKRQRGLAGRTENVLRPSPGAVQRQTPQSAPVDVEARVEAGFAPIAGSRGFDRFTFLPIEQDVATGEIGFGLPGVIQEPLESAVTIGRVARGEEPIRDIGGNIRADLVGPALDVAGFGTGAPVGRAIRGARGAAATAARNEALERAARAREFGIDLTRGQAGREFVDQAFEEDALTGGAGAGAQRILQNQRERQGQQIAQAVEDITKRTSPSRIGDPFEAAENVQTAVSDVAQRLRAGSQGAFQEAERLGGTISIPATKRFAGELYSKLDEVGAMEGTEVGSDMPTVRRIMKGVDRLASLENAPEGSPVSIDYRAFERIRKQITNAKGATPDEGRVLGELRRATDDWLEDSVENGLISGNPEFLTNLKNARRLWSQYRNITGNPRKIIRNMADKELDSRQISDFLYGASKIGGRSDSAAIVRNIKDLIGGDNPAINDLRRGVAMRLFNEPRGEGIKGVQKLAGDIQEFTTGKGRELAKALYDNRTIAELNRFSQVLRNLKPDDLAQNPSRSGQTIGRRFTNAVQKLAPLVGVAAGDLQGLIAGLLISGGTAGVGRARALRAVRSAIPEDTSPLSVPLGDAFLRTAILNSMERAEDRPRTATMEEFRRFRQAGGA